jgi:hypothetical protein
MAARSLVIAEEPAAPRLPGHRASERLGRAIEATARRWPWVLGTLMLIEGLILFYAGHGFSFFDDDWIFVTHDYGGGLHSLLIAHNGNISVFPLLVYKALFRLVGLRHYAVYRLVVIVLHLICAGLIFALAARRIPRVPALLATALILFLGAAWEDLLWAFQVGYFLSIVGGLATWLLLEREDGLGDIAAMLCLTLAAGSSSLGIAMMVGVGVELLWRGGERRRLWIVLVPALLYALWYLGYGESQVTDSSLIATPRYVLELIAAAFGGLIGRGLEWGRPLALVGLLVLLRRLVRPLPVSPRLAGLLATGIALWMITAAARSTISPPGSSRYIYLGAVVIVLVGVELLRGVTITPRAIWLAAVLIACSAITGLTVMHENAIGRRENAETVTAELGALELAAAHAPAHYELDAQRAPGLLAGPYLRAVREMGSSPADTPSEIRAAEPEARAAADRILLALETPALRALGRARLSALTPAPTVTSVNRAARARHAECIQLTPHAGGAMSLTLILPRGGVLIRDEGPARTTLALERFGEIFRALPGVLAAHRQGVLALPADSALARMPWQLRLASASRLSLCGLPT